ncbi:MAG: hypothetical protein JNJ89_06665 [Rubrivivax sp.]|nr:hypothetical protein [Rubrivivax sp.]
MRRPPVAKVAALAALWSRFAAVVAFGLGAAFSGAAAAAQPGAASAVVGEAGHAQADEGRRLYEGTHPALVAMLPRGAALTPLPPQHAACVTCHRPSGLGSFEGEAAVPPIASGLLARPFDPATTRRYGPSTRTAGGTALLRVRPAYDAPALHRLLTEGRTPDDRDLGPLMPRYRLEPRHSAALLEHLKRLGTAPTPGVDDEVVHFATVTTDEVPAAQVKELVHLLREFFARKNAQTRGEPQRRAAAQRTEHTMYARYRRWELHHWVLRGAPETWAAQLRKSYARRPVFAMLSGRGGSTWSPVHDFCESERLPCLFPITPWPGAAQETPGFYSVYFSGGVPAQARWLAETVLAAAEAPGPPPPAPPWLVLAGEDAAGRQLAMQVFSELGAAARTGGRSLTMAPHWRGEPVVVSALPAAEVARRLAAQTPAAAAPPRPASATVYLLAGAGVPDAAPVAWPPGVRVHWVTQQDPQPSRLARARAWWRGQGFRPADEAQAAQVLLAATAAVESLVHVDERFSREYCLEKLEHNLENLPPMTGYPRLALGPGQRLAAKSVWMVALP